MSDVKEAKVYGSLEDLVKSEAVVMADPEQGPRVYRVRGTTKSEEYVVAVSPGQAALACCEVELVGRNKLLKAALAALAASEGPDAAEEPTIKATAKAG